MQYIQGQWVEGQAVVLISENPATGEKVWQGKEASAAQVEQAVQAAHDAFEGWALTPFEERAAILQKYADYCEAHRDNIIEILCREGGKIRWDAAGEAGAVIGKLNASLNAYAERTPSRSTELNGVSASLRHKPHGVMAVFGPYNFPMHIPGGHIIPALLAGNTVVFKPSELVPAGGEWLVKALEQAGVPAGVVNLVQGSRPVGEALAKAKIQGLLFTGSSATGTLLHKQFAGRPEVLLALELGGNNPLIISKVSDLSATAYEVVQSAYMSAGQRCTCARRLIVVEETTPDGFVEHLAEMVRSITVGPYTQEPEPYMGPLIHRKEVDRALNMQETLHKAGAELLVEGKALDAQRPFLSPGLIDVTALYHAGKLPDEEVFGPQLKLIRVKTLEEAVRVANDTSFGLSSAIFTDDAAEYQYVSEHLRAGLINWNKATTGASGMAPFGGCGLSGNHRPAGFYAADYCAYPVASMEQEKLTLPEKSAPGITV